MARPNLVIIMADQLRRDFVGGGYTPRINELLGESTVFERAYCASPLCVPARGAFFTGRYPNATGCILNPWEKTDYSHGLVAAGTPNLYALLEDGWDSWHTGKQHFLTEEDMENTPGTRTHWNTLEKEYGPFLRAHGKRSPGGPAYRGLMPEMARGRITRVRDYSLPVTGCYGEELPYFFDGYITDCSLEAIRNRDRSRPFALNAMFLAPHPPLCIPEPYYSRFPSPELPPGVGVWSPDQSPLQLYNLPGVLGSRYRREDWREVWRVYGGLVNLLDDCVGRILDALRDEGLYDDTVIVFTADHGEMLGSHCLWQKMCMYEESAHVPLAVKPPKGAAHRARCPGLVSHLDVLPTLCDLLGLDTPRGVQGLSLAGAMAADALPDRDHLFIQYDGNGARGNFSRCVVGDRLKLIVDIFKDEVYYELYDLAEDPAETRNRAFDEPEAVRALETPLRRHMQDTGDLVSYPRDAYRRFLADYAPYRKGK